jgi:5-hydroxyisourate hydrolase
VASAGRLTTHVLDTMHGKPAAGMRVDLKLLHGDHFHMLISIETNADGRLDQPLLEGERFEPGTYELDFHVGAYFDALGIDIGSPFLDLVPVRFEVTERAHYHVPLVVSPFSYSTYRGS